MGLFDNIANAVSGALGQGDDKGDGAHNILSNLLQQGVSGQSGNIVGQLLGGLGGAQGGDLRRLGGAQDEKPRRPLLPHPGEGADQRREILLLGKPAH